MNVTDRFLRYVKFDTQSDEQTNLTPSTILRKNWKIWA